MHPSIRERDSRTRDQLGHSSGNEHLAGLGRIGYTRSDVHSDPPDVAVSDLDLSAVYSHPEHDSKLSCSRDDRDGARDRTSRTVEREKDPVAGSFDQPPTEA